LRPKLHVDALLYCLCWAALALFGWDRGGMVPGLLLSIGLFPLVMLSSMTVLSRTGNFKAEQAIRWGILAVAAIGLMAWLDLRG
jgi:hypothetical protein